MKENLLIVRDILFKSFIIGFTVLVLTCLLFMFKLNYFAGIAHNMFGIDKQSYTFAAMLVMGMAKNVLFFLYLFPAIAIHLTLKCNCNKETKS